MRKFVIAVVIFSISLTGWSYTWQSFCPSTIHATNICFGVGSWKGVICSPVGMHLWEDDIEEWTFYTYGGLPVTGAAYLNATQILVAMGCGTYSDGIYTFDLATHQFEVSEWIVEPTFLIIIPVLDKQKKIFTDEYFCGSQFGGLWNSVDGIEWNEVPYFSGKSCTAMDFFDSHFVVTETGNVSNIYWSDDYGVTWNPSVAPTVITDLKFDNTGGLYGIFPGYSNSSGLYRSDDYGNTWEVEFWYDNMSAVGFDAGGTPFVGWESPAAGNEGIAMYNPLAPPPGLFFMNNGLASTNINKILLNPVLSSIAIFCCTDSGVYMCNDYLVGIPDITADKAIISIYPNPVLEKAIITIDPVTEMELPADIIILDNQGLKVDEIILNSNFAGQLQIHRNKGYLPAGVYYIILRYGNKKAVEKFIIL